MKQAHSNSEQRWILYLAVTIKFHLAAMCQNHCLHSIFTQSEECQHRWRGWSYRHVDVTITIILHVLFQAGCNLTITHTAKTPRPQLPGGRLPGAGACPDWCRHHAAALRIYRWQEGCSRPAPAPSPPILGCFLSLCLQTEMKYSYQSSCNYPGATPHLVMPFKWEGQQQQILIVK